MRVPNVRFGSEADIHDEAAGRPLIAKSGRHRDGLGGCRRSSRPGSQRSPIGRVYLLPRRPNPGGRADGAFPKSKGRERKA